MRISFAKKIHDVTRERGRERERERERDRMRQQVGSGLRVSKNGVPFFRPSAL